MLLWEAGGSTAVLEEQRWETEEGATITFDPSVMSEVTREVFEGFLALPKRGLEVGGILFGRASGSTPGSVHIDGFEPVPCDHQFGPSYVFSQRDRERLDAILLGHRQRGANIAGWYRSYTGRDLALDDADRELIAAHFAGQRCVYLQLRPVTLRQCVIDLAYLTGEEQRSTLAPPVPEWGPRTEEPHVPPQVIEPEPVADPVPLGPAVAAVPAPEVNAEQVSAPTYTLPECETPPERASWLLWSIALTGLLLALVATYLWWQVSERIDSLQAASAPPSRSFTPAQVPAAPVEPPAPPAAAASDATPSNQSPPPEAPAADARVAVQAEPIDRVEPKVPEGVRARISGRMEIPLRVAIDRAGRVTSVQSPRQGDSLYQFVALAAIKAARQTRFQPAKAKDGKPVASTRTIVYTVDGPGRTVPGSR